MYFFVLIVHRLTNDGIFRVVFPQKSAKPSFIKRQPVPGFNPKILMVDPPANDPFKTSPRRVRTNTYYYNNSRGMMCQEVQLPAV